MKRLNIVITMGGLGSRFSKAGYNMPKYMIEAKGKTLFDWSILSLRGYHSITKQYIFVVKANEHFAVRDFIVAHCLQLGIEKYEIVVIDYLTDGQASTAMLAKPYWEANDALLIYNIDTYVEAGQMNAAELKGDGFIPCFTGEGDHWSFVKLDAEGKAIEIQEKKRISPYCTLGAYYFKSCALYEMLYKEYCGNHAVKGEKYVAPLYNCLISRGGHVFISNIDSAYVHVLGTPEELNHFLENRR